MSNEKKLEEEVSLKNTQELSNVSVDESTMDDKLVEDVDFVYASDDDDDDDESLMAFTDDVINSKQTSQDENNDRQKFDENNEETSPDEEYLELEHENVLDEISLNVDPIEVELDDATLDYQNTSHEENAYASEHTNFKNLNYEDEFEDLEELGSREAFISDNEQINNQQDSFYDAENKDLDEASNDDETVDEADYENIEITQEQLVYPNNINNTDEDVEGVQHEEELVYTGRVNNTDIILNDAEDINNEEQLIYTGNIDDSSNVASDSEDIEIEEEQLVYTGNLDDADDVLDNSEDIELEEEQLIYTDNINNSNDVLDDSEGMELEEEHFTYNDEINYIEAEHDEQEEIEFAENSSSEDLNEMFEETDESEFEEEFEEEEESEIKKFTNQEELDRYEEEEYINSNNNDEELYNISDSGLDDNDDEINIQDNYTDESDEELDSMLENESAQGGLSWNTLKMNNKSQLSPFEEQLMDLSLNATMSVSSELFKLSQQVDLMKDFLDKQISKISSNIKESLDNANKTNNVESVGIDENMLEEFKIQLAKYLVENTQNADVSDDIYEIKDTVASSMVEIGRSMTASLGDMKESMSASTVEIGNSVTASLDDIKQALAASIVEMGSSMSSSLIEIKKTMASSFDELNALKSLLDSVKSEIANIQTTTSNSIEESKVLEEVNEADTQPPVRTAVVVSTPAPIQSTENEYTYSLSDVESDIAKLRVALNDVKTNIKTFLTSIDDLPNSSQIDCLYDDISSISKRTNKLILTSDESHKTLKHYLEEFDKVISVLNERAEKLNIHPQIILLQKKLESIFTATSNVSKSNKILQDAMVYLAQWVDSASETYEAFKKDLGYIKNIVEDNSVINSKFKEQTEKLETLDDKITNLAKSDKEVKTILEEIALSLSQVSEYAKETREISQRLEVLEHKMSKFEKNVNKIASYIEE